MADSLKTRVGRVIAGGVHALLDRLEDQAPEAMMEQAIREADSVIADVRHELGTTSANRHLAQQQHLNLNRQHEGSSEQVTQALAQQREDLARVAIARQLDIEAQLPVLEATLAEFARQEAELRGYVEALLAKRREMESALTEFRKSRLTGQGGTAAGRVGGVDTADHRMAAATGAFDRVHQRQTGMSATTVGASLQQAAQLRELEDLVRQRKIEDRLAQWKAQR